MEDNDRDSRSSNKKRHGITCNTSSYCTAICGMCTPCLRRSGSAQAKLKFTHLQLRLKQKLLRSKDGNGNCSCRDSDVEFPVSARYLQIRGWRTIWKLQSHGIPDLINIGGATVLSSMVSLEVEGLARSMRHNKSGGELAS